MNDLMRYLMMIWMIMASSEIFSQSITVIKDSSIVSPVNKALKGMEVKFNFSQAAQQSYKPVGDSINVYLKHTDGTITYQKFACLINPENISEYRFKEVKTSAGAPIVYLRGYKTGGYFNVA